jgi:hypothetical protein
MRRLARLTVGGVTGLLAAVATATGIQWYWSAIVFSAAIVIMLGRRRIVRAGVTRRPDELVCRYIPWFESNALFGFVLLPLIGISAVAAGNAPDNPTWVRYVGLALLAVTPVIMFSVVSMWRRCILVFSPSALTIRTAAPKDVLTEIPRHRVRSITPKIVPNGVSGESLQVEIVYETSDSGSDTKTVMLGLQLSVRPQNLLDALVAWKDATGDDPNELLDRIEEILRGRSPAAV